MIIARKEELGKLKESYKSSCSSFVAIYGRRGCGKTFLVEKAFGQRLTFSFSGIANKPKSLQIKMFLNALKNVVYPSKKM